MPYVSYTTEAFTLYSTLTLYVAFKKHVVVEVSRNARTHGNCDRPSRNANSKWALISDWAADFLYVRERHSLAARALISALPAHARSGVCVCVSLIKAAEFLELLSEKALQALHQPTPNPHLSVRASSQQSTRNRTERNLLRVESFLLCCVLTLCPFPTLLL